VNWRTILAHAPLPMLALAASYGVYQYARLYVPDEVAFVQAAAFEMTYIGLTVAELRDPAQRTRARMVSFGAVVTSIIYNTLAGLFHRVPLASFALPVYGELAFAALHGLPLAWVAYLVADLLLHTSAPAERAPGRIGVRARIRAWWQQRTAQPQTGAPQIRALPTHACRKCGASVETQQQSAASARWGCVACKVTKEAA
jgi:hypothetical protein